MAANPKPRPPRREPLQFVADQPRSFAYCDDEDEFEVPPIPTLFAVMQRQVSLSWRAHAPASSFDRVAAGA